MGSVIRFSNSFELISGLRRFANAAMDNMTIPRLMKPCAGAKDRPATVCPAKRRMIGEDDRARRRRGARACLQVDDRSWEAAMRLAEQAALHAVSWRIRGERKRC
eukprot:Skav208544  [mRNA]  locus=scaffold1216:364564:373603:+ [translate_table: standard]